MKVTATKLRQNLYNLLDEVLKTGRPIEIERKGKVLKIITEKPKSKLSNLEFHDVIIGKPEDIINIDWMKEWDSGENL
jgi:prevent-host-death family protein